MTLPKPDAPVSDRYDHDKSAYLGLDSSEISHASEQDSQIGRNPSLAVITDLSTGITDPPYTAKQCYLQIFDPGVLFDGSPGRSSTSGVQYETLFGPGLVFRQYP